MTTATEGMELTRVGPGTVMGDLMRQLLDARGHVLGARARRRADPPDAARREADRLSRQRRPRRRDGPSLPAPLRVAVPGTQRGRRHPLHLSRLEVRRRRQLPRHAEPAAAGLQAEGEGQGLQGGRARRRGLGLHGSRAEAPPLPAFEILDVPEDEIKRQLHPARLQLSAGARGRDRHLAFRLPARRPRRSRRAAGGRAGPATRSSTARRSITWPRCPGARSMPATARPDPDRPTGASATSCFRSGRRRPTASSAATCMRAPGCRSTTSHTMFCFIWWKRAVSAMSLPQPAFKDGTPIGGTGARQQDPAQHHRLARPLAARRRTADNDWGIDRAAQQQQRDLQRHRRHPPAGPGDHREHGRRSSTTRSSTWRRPTR